MAVPRVENYLLRTVKEVLMLLVRRLSPALLVICLLVLAGPQPWAAPEFGPWTNVVKLAGPIGDEATYGPAVTRDGLTLFCTRGSGLASNLYVSRRQSVADPWGAPQSLGAPVNTEYTEMIPGLSRDEHFLFFTSDRPGSHDGVVSRSWDLWAAWRPDTKDPFGWQTPFNLGDNVNTGAQETTGSYFENEQGPPLLFFASNRLMGAIVNDPAVLPIGHDIYVSALKEDGTFGPAVLDEDLSLCLGGKADLEGRPMVRFDGREVIFVSDRAGTMGSGTQDLWVATRGSIDEPWREPVNLGAPVNTTAAEMHPYLSPDGTTLYFSRRIGTAPYLHMATRERPGKRVGQDR